MFMTLFILLYWFKLIITIKYMYYSTEINITLVLLLKKK